MKFLMRVLKFFAGLVTGFAGYFIIAAEGWGEPLESMHLERGVIGGLIGVLGLALVWRAFVPAKPPRRPAPRSVAALEPVHDAFSLAPSEPTHTSDDHAPAAVQAAEPAASEPQAAASEAPVEAAPEPAPPFAQASPTPEAIAALIAKGDRLAAEGRFEDALDPYSEALHLARVHHAAQPDNADASRILAGALKSNADVYDDEGRVDSAIDLYEEALALNRSLAASGSPADRRTLSLTLERLGDSREARGHRSRAADLYRESLGIAEGLVRDDPGNPLYAEDLAVTRRRLEELEGVGALA